MLKTIVIYQSSTGFTKQYAQWIAEELSCEAIELAKVTGKLIEDNDRIIFGGWIMGNMINGLDKIRKMNPKELVIFAVGSTPQEIINVEEIKSINHINSDESFYYMVGGFRFEKLNFMVRGMLKALKKQDEKKENKTAQEQYMADKLGTSFDLSDRKYIHDLVGEMR